MVPTKHSGKDRCIRSPLFTRADTIFTCLWILNLVNSKAFLICLRRMPLFLRDLMSLKNRHPSLYAELKKNGNFMGCKTGNRFSSITWTTSKQLENTKLQFQRWWEWLCWLLGNFKISSCSQVKSVGGCWACIQFLGWCSLFFVAFSFWCLLLQCFSCFVLGERNNTKVKCGWRSKTSKKGTRSEQKLEWMRMID